MAEKFSLELGLYLPSPQLIQNFEVLAKAIKPATEKSGVINSKETKSSFSGDR